MNCGEPKLIFGPFYRTGNDISIKSRKTAEWDISKDTRKNRTHLKIQHAGLDKAKVSKKLQHTNVEEGKHK